MTYVRFFMAFALFIISAFAISYLYYKLAVWTNGVTYWLIPLILFGPIIVITLIGQAYEIYFAITKRKDPK